MDVVGKWTSNRNWIESTRSAARFLRGILHEEMATMLGSGQTCGVFTPTSKRPTRRSAASETARFVRTARHRHKARGNPEGVWL
jgi:hypothetical protein